MADVREVEAALRAAGAVLMRKTRHLVYRRPNGRSVVIPRSGSDHRWTRRALADIARKAAAR